MNFPFTAVAGQSSFKLALILALIDPAIGGVLVSGPRGCAKSTLARGMVDIMPVNSSVEDIQEAKFVTLPLGATTDMLVGTLSLSHVLSEQSVQFQPGLLSRAHNGVLYVDEVNLLSDHLVDLLLDVSASGVNVIERDGISHQHAARFVLLGTMNPDEGELRPQLQDRFGLSVQLGNRYSVSERIEIVRLRETFDADPQAFIEQQTQQQQALSARISLARKQVGSVTCSEVLRQSIAEQCMEANVDGLRADIVWLRAAVAHSAYHARSHVQAEDVEAVAELVLAHRRNSPPVDSDRSAGARSENSQAQTPSSVSQSRHPSSANSSNPSSSSSSKNYSGASEGDSNNSNQPFAPAPEGEPGTDSGGEADWGQMPAQTQSSTTGLALLPLAWMQSSQADKAPIKKTRPIQEAVATARGNTAYGNRTEKRMSTSINWFSTLLDNAGQWPLRTLRYRRARTGDRVVHLVLLDTSASTLQSRWFSRAKGAVLQIAEQVYLVRDQLAIIGFGNQSIDTLLPQKRAPKSLRLWLDAVSAAGGTPMRAIIEHALQYQKNQQRRSPGTLFKTYIITDGRTLQSFGGLRLLGKVLVIDIEQSAIRRGRAAELAHTLRATYWQLPA